MSKTNIPKKVIEIIKELEMTKDETLWDCHGTWVMYHKALEKIAAHKGVTFDEPKVIHSDVALNSVTIQLFFNFILKMRITINLM